MLYISFDPTQMEFSAAFGVRILKLQVEEMNPEMLDAKSCLHKPIIGDYQGTLMGFLFPEK